MAYLWRCWTLHWSKALMEWSIELACRSGLDWVEDREHLFLVKRLPRCRSGVWSGASRVDFDFTPSSLCFVGWLEEAFIASLSWMYGCARERTLLILETLCFRTCLYGRWVTYNTLMNASADMSSPQLEWAGFERSCCRTCGCLPASSWQRGCGDYSSWLLGEWQTVW